MLWSVDRLIAYPDVSYPDVTSVMEGLPQFAHDDDFARVVIVANMRRVLSRLLGLVFLFGVSPSVGE